MPVGLNKMEKGITDCKIRSENTAIAEINHSCPGTNSEETLEDILVSALFIQKQKYELYFESLPPDKIDNPAMTAYAGILKKIVEIRKDAGGFKIDAFSRFFKDFVEFLAKEDPESVKIIAEYFDGFTGFVKEKYVNKSFGYK